MSRTPAVAALALVIAACARTPAPPAAADDDDAAAAIAPPRSPATVRMSWRVPEVGTVESSTWTTSFRLTVGASPYVANQRWTRRLEVLEVDATTVGKAAVSYDGQVSASLPGRRYRVWRGDGWLEASRDDGFELTALERGALDAELGGQIGEVPHLAQLLSQRSWTVGERVVLTAEQLAIFEDLTSGQIVLRSGAVTARSVIGALITFDADLAIALDGDPGDDVGSTLQVELEVDTGTTWVTRQSFHATINGMMSGTRVHGTVIAATELRYQVP